MLQLIFTVLIYNSFTPYFVLNGFLLHIKMIAPNNDFDVVIPLGPNDVDIISKQVKYTRKYVIGCRHIFIISYDESINIEGCITISETKFPFTMETVYKHHGKRPRNGWYLQQLLKLYAGLIIPDILDKYLVIDSDTFFIKPTVFYENEKCVYNYGTNVHKPYFIHMEKLHPEFKQHDILKSGICNYMIFETKYVKELFDMVEEKHNELFYNVFLNTVTDHDNSGASEYEIYFNFIINKYSDKIIIRKLNGFEYTAKYKDNGDNLEKYCDNYDYISYHWYCRY